MKSSKRRRASAYSGSDGEDEEVLPSQHRKRAIDAMEGKLASLAGEVSALQNALMDLRKFHGALEAEGDLLDAQLRSHGAAALLEGNEAIRSPDIVQASTFAAHGSDYVSNMHYPWFSSTEAASPGGDFSVDRFQKSCNAADTRSTCTALQKETSNSYQAAQRSQMPLFHDSEDAASYLYRPSAVAADLWDDILLVGYPDGQAEPDIINVDGGIQLAAGSTTGSPADVVRAPPSTAAPQSADPCPAAARPPTASSAPCAAAPDIPASGILSPVGAPAATPAPAPPEGHGEQAAASSLARLQPPAAGGSCAAALDTLLPASLDLWQLQPFEQAQEQQLAHQQQGLMQVASQRASAGGGPSAAAQAQAQERERQGPTPPAASRRYTPAHEPFLSSSHPLPPHPSSQAAVPPDTPGARRRQQHQQCWTGLAAAGSGGGACTAAAPALGSPDGSTAPPPTSCAPPGRTRTFPSQPDVGRQGAVQCGPDPWVPSASAAAVAADDGSAMPSMGAPGVAAACNGARPAVASVAAAAAAPQSLYDAWSSGDYAAAAVQARIKEEDLSAAGRKGGVVAGVGAEDGRLLARCALPAPQQPPQQQVPMPQQQQQQPQPGSWAGFGAALRVSGGGIGSGAVAGIQDAAATVSVATPVKTAAGRLPPFSTVAAAASAAAAAAGTPTSGGMPSPAGGRAVSAVSQSGTTLAAAVGAAGLGVCGAMQPAANEAGVTAEQQQQHQHQQQAVDQQQHSGPLCGGSPFPRTRSSSGGGAAAPHHPPQPFGLHWPPVPYPPPFLPPPFAVPVRYPPHGSPVRAIRWRRLPPPAPLPGQLPPPPPAGAPGAGFLGNPWEPLPKYVGGPPAASSHLLASPPHPVAPGHPLHPHTPLPEPYLSAGPPIGPPPSGGPAYAPAPVCLPSGVGGNTGSIATRHAAGALSPAAAPQQLLHTTARLAAPLTLGPAAE